MVLLSGSWFFHLGSALNPGSYKYVLPLVHGSFPFWTLLCGVYRPYGLIFFTNFNRSITAICFGDAYSPMYQWATNGTSKIVSYSSVVLRLVRLLLFYGMFCELPMLHCEWMYQCQQVHLNWPYLFQMCASLFDGCTYLWPSLWGFFNLGWLTLVCYAIALHVCQITFEHCPGVVWK
jgi:hypothetical protein